MDTDNDGLDDDYEIAHFGNLSQTATTDFDEDGILDGEEYTFGLDPTTDDTLSDLDGDRYPNAFEIHNGSDPSNAASVPTPTFVVNGARGGTHASVNAAVSAAASQSGTYIIIGIAPGVYTEKDPKGSIERARQRSASCELGNKADWMASKQIDSQELMLQ